MAPAVCSAHLFKHHARRYVQVYVKTPYLELHTGPGRGYPVFDVVPQGERVTVLFRRTQWLKVRTRRGAEGWASEDDMLQTVLADGRALPLHIGNRAGFTSHRFEAGAFAGVYGGANLVSAYTSLSFNPQLAVEASVGQILGRYSNGVTADIGLTHVPMPQWRLSPFLMLGLGVLHVEPKATLVQPANRTEQTAYVGGGFRYYIGRSFFLRAEYKTHVVITTQNRNQVEDEWKLGFAVFF
ncbi:MAG: SH3 domain-containing protein [Gammaproteobacteria bacterium]|nr:SH3 domain-containing protein [Gammaproteobacteria bacterium]